MNVLEFPFALFAFFGLVAVVPVWVYFVGAYAPGLPPEAAFMARFALPVTVALFIAGWLQPGG